MARRELAGASVVVTGGGGGIGAALGRRFTAAGCRVALLDIGEEATAAVAGEIGEAAVAIACDVTDEDSCRRAIAAAAAANGPVDILVNNAGLSHRSAFSATDFDVLHRIMDVNFWGAVYCTKTALPSLMARSGAIAVTSSVAGFAPLLGRTGYAASKHAIHDCSAHCGPSSARTGWTSPSSPPPLSTLRSGTTPSAATAPSPTIPSPGWAG